MNSPEQCHLSGNVSAHLAEHSTPFSVFENALDFAQLVEIIVKETNKYAQQNGRNFSRNSDEIRAFLGINFVMGINKLPSIDKYWAAE